MHTPDEPDISLNKKIEELESLIDTKEVPSLPDTPVTATASNEDPDSNEMDIPVLDELVTTEDYADTGTCLDKPSYTEHQLAAFISDLESKLTGELDRLVSVIKGTMKESIADELRTRFDAQLDDQETQHPIDQPDHNRQQGPGQE